MPPPDPTAVCDECGMLIPSWAPAGNCPACLFDDGVETKEHPAEPAEPTREKIGDWELQERIGEGAFGVVYAAEQRKPVQRTAALKILRPGMASKEILARFEAESQALALMNHPDIVTIYDAGTTDDGRPYLVMEFVPGVPVTEFAAGLPISQKLLLFDRIGAVVEHAHQRGIIHRDLKPANILAYEGDDGRPVIKLLDFGIAKATEHVLTDATILTREGHSLGTPEYMSPEQTTEVDIDIRSDVYSLGVILFELLAGRPPFVLDSTSLEAIVKFLDRVRQESAPALSAVGSEEIPQDLDWIVRKAIEKERERRYSSVTELRDDLRRFRDDKPIEARPPDTLYLARKFLRRHWKLTAALAAIALSITGAAVVSSVMAVRANRATEETRIAYSNSDLRAAIGEINRGDISHGIALLVRGLRTDPANRGATMLLRSTLENFPVPEPLLRAKLSDKIVRGAHFIRPDGSLAVVSEIGKVRFLDPRGKNLAPAIQFGGTNQVSAISPDGKLMAVCNLQGNVALIDLENHRQLPLDDTVMEKGSYLVGLGFSPDSTGLCFASVEGRIYYWNTGDGSLRWRYEAEVLVPTLVFANRGRDVIFATRNGQRLDLVAASGERSMAIPQQAERVHGLLDSEEGFRYYTISTTGIVSACDKDRPPRTFTEEQVDVPLVLTAADPERRLTAYASERELGIWTVEGRVEVRRFELPDPPTCLEVFTASGLAFVGTTESGLHVWDFEKKELACGPIPRARNVVAMQVDLERQLLRCVTRDGILQHFRIPARVEPGRHAQRLPDRWETVRHNSRNSHFVRQSQLDLRNFERLPDSPPRAVAATRDGNRIFGAFRDGIIRGWDAETGELLHEIEATASSVRSLDVSGDGTLLAYRDQFGYVAIWNLESDEVRRFRTQVRRDVSSIAISPDKQFFATTSDDGDARLFSTTSGEPLTEKLMHETNGAVLEHFCRVSDDGRMLVSWGASDRAFRIWDTASGQLIGTPVIGRGNPVFAQFQPGSRFLVTVTVNDNGTHSLRVLTLPELTPVTPELTISIESFDFSEIPIPEDTRFSSSELDRIEIRNGLRMGDNGLTRITHDAPSQTAPGS